MLMTKNFYITTPIYYPNARPHVGSAYTTIACDAIARYKRMCGYEVAFLTGTDEHGEKLQRAADAAGMPVEQFVAEKRELFKELWRVLDIGEFRDTSASGVEATPGSDRSKENGGVQPPLPLIDYRFVHTSQNPAHRASVHWMIRQADKAGYIEKKRYEGRYCVFDERYVSDSSEPVNCDICGRPAELISEENYFFKLSAFQERLLKLYDEHPEFVLPDFRMNEVKSFVKGGLRDISISRHRLKWGIPWPGDDQQVVYVWYDALTSYLTGIGFEGEKRSKDFEKYWMGADGPSEVVHMMAKDILRFHAVYWPAFLMAANDALPHAERLPLPKTVFAHGWIYYEQDKMSKSKGNVVYPEPIIRAFEEFGASGNDALRYYLLRDTPFGQDAHFSYEGLIHRYNSDLVNDLGNLASRSLAMVHQFCAGAVPQGESRSPKLRDIEGLFPVYRDALDAFDLASALIAVWQLISNANKLIVETKPWELAKSDSQVDQERLRATLYDLLEGLRVASITLYPILPSSAERLWKHLGCDGVLGRVEDQRIDRLRWGQLKPGTRVAKPQPVFPRLKKEDILRRLDELAEQDRAADQTLQEVRTQLALDHERDLIPETDVVPGPEVKVAVPESRVSSPGSQKITIHDFAKVDLRAGTIVAAEPLPGATKLLKLQVDIGPEVRQVCAGIAEYYKPEQLIGMKVVLVANLQPRKIRGVESNGMIVAASVGEKERPVLVTFNEEVENGARLK
jgi:methionyl-tRNA synthetase